MSKSNAALRGLGVVAIVATCWSGVYWGTHRAMAASRGCVGAADCRVCKNCKYCKHCAKDGGTCGVNAPATRPTTRPSRK